MCVSQGRLLGNDIACRYAKVFFVLLTGYQCIKVLICMCVCMCWCICVCVCVVQAIDSDLRKLDVLQANQHVSYLCSFMSDNFTKRGSTVKILLFDSSKVSFDLCINYNYMCHLLIMETFYLSISL